MDRGLEDECRDRRIVWVKMPLAIAEFRRQLRIALDDPAL
jgi:hypothetical protein